MPPGARLQGPPGIGVTAELDAPDGQAPGPANCSRRRPPGRAVSRARESPGLPLSPGTTGRTCSNVTPAPDADLGPRRTWNAPLLPAPLPPITPGCKEAPPELPSQKQVSQGQAGAPPLPNWWSRNSLGAAAGTLPRLWTFLCSRRPSKAPAHCGLEGACSRCLASLHC